MTNKNPGQRPQNEPRNPSERDFDTEKQRSPEPRREKDRPDTEEDQRRQQPNQPRNK